MRHTYRFGLIGHHVSYSRSGDVFRAIFSLMGERGAFDTFDVAPAEFHERLVELVRDGVQGLSVTIPYKHTIMEHLQEVDAIADALDVVNSVSIDHDALCGFNTDCFGFSLPLQKYAEELKHGSALILGCGGVARAAVYSLYTDYEVRRFSVVGRTRARLIDFKECLERQLRRVKILPIVIKGASSHRWDSTPFDIIVNCTPLGGWNHPDGDPVPDGLPWRVGRIYYDVNYNQGNKLVEKARKAGLVAIDGSTMLVGQALRSFDIWTGDTVAFEPVYEQVFRRATELT